MPLRRLLVAFSLLLLGLAPLQATAQSRSEALLPDDWLQTGTGEMRWFGLRIYDARLLSAPGTRWAADAAPAADAAFALELTYARDIPGKQLVETSIDELARLGWREPALLTRWGEQLAKVFPDVRAGERILGLRDPARGALFYHQGRLTGALNDPELARAFFAIWLDPRTREPGLRERLLGLR